MVRHCLWMFIQVGWLGKELSPALLMAFAISWLPFRDELNVST